MRGGGWLALGAVVAMGGAVARWPVEYRRVASPDDRHEAVATTAFGWSLVPAFPGQAGDRPGTVTVRTRDGRSCGSAPVDMVSAIADLRWSADTAELPLVARWDLHACRVVRTDDRG